MKLPTWLSRRKPIHKLFDVKKDHRIVEAFKLYGVQYYHFEDIFNMCAGRAFCAIDYYQELQMKCTREFLQAHIAASNNKINAAIEAMTVKAGELNLDKVLTPLKDNLLLNTQIQERLDMIIDSDTAYKLASVVYFDETESPYGFNYEYAQKKIKAWKKTSAADFFLQAPVRDLIPFGDLTKDDLNNYLIVTDKMNQAHLENIFTMLFNKDKKEDFYKTLDLQKAATKQQPTLNG